MTWTIWHSRRVRLATLFVAGALTLAGAVLVWALRPVVIPPSDAATPAMAPAGELPLAPVAPAHLEALDPFAEQRQSEAAPDVVPPTAPFALLGTIAGTTPPTAVCQLGNATPRILHPGDTLGGWRLQQVWPGRALFIDGGGAQRELRLSPLGH
ncbi:MAG: hypothetical protein P3B98_01975 [Gemmatimonadota bacterium]|nr:hypothetical protein [Gemmatimonadota bacterium]